jgi:hypothetical protein
MKKQDNRGNLYLLTALILGIVSGLLYGWMIDPVHYDKTTPKVLRADFKDRYRALIAEAFLANQDIGRATSRLALLGDTDGVVALTLQAQRAIAENRPEAEIQALTYLMLALSQSDAPFQLPTLAAPMGLPTLAFTSTATATLLPLPTSTPVIRPSGDSITGTQTVARNTPTPNTPTPSAAFALLEQNLICDLPQETPSLQIETKDIDGKPIPGVPISVRREDNDSEERFFTGLKPEISLGYADFSMTPGINYVLWVGDGGQPIQLETPICKSGNKENWGIWKLLFIQP